MKTFKREESMFLQALNIRIEYAIAKLNRDAQQMENVALDAESLAIPTFDPTNETPIPFLFQDEPALAEAFSTGLAHSHLGQWLTEELAEMAHCSNCNDGSGNPCLVHG